MVRKVTSCELNIVGNKKVAIMLMCGCGCGHDRWAWQCGMIGGCGHDRWAWQCGMIGDCGHDGGCGYDKLDSFRGGRTHRGSYNNSVL